MRPHPRVRLVLDVIGHGLTPAIALIVGLFVVLAFCCYPVADDFIFACRSTEHGFWSVQSFWYREWSCKYFGTLCITSYLALFGLVDAYWLVPILLLVGTWAATLLLVRRLLARGLRLRDMLHVATLLLAIYLAGVRGPGESFYWMTAAFEYQVAAIMLLLGVGLLAGWRGGAGNRFVAALPVALIAFCAVGSTEIMMVAVVITTLSWLIVAAPRHWRANLPLLLVPMAVAGGAALMILSPGNDARGSHFSAASGRLGSTVALATQRGLWIALVKWSLSPALLGATLMFWRHAPLIHRNGLRRIVRLRMANPVPVLWLLAVVIACTAVPYWAGGFKPPKRAEGNIWVVFLLGWFLLVLPFLYGILRRRAAFQSGPAVMRCGRALLVLGLFVPGNVPYALSDVLGGSAFRYRREQIERTAAVAAARQRGEREVDTTQLEARPKTIWIEDLAEAAEANQWFARWCGVESVRASPKGAESKGGVTRSPERR